MTGGCTSQACNFRDRYPQIQEKGAVVLGVSKDSVDKSNYWEKKKTEIQLRIQHLEGVMSEYEESLV